MDTNVGMGMVPHRHNCRCTECELERSAKRLAELEKENKRLREVLKEIHDHAESLHVAERVAKSALEKGE